VLTADSIDFSKRGLASRLPIRVFNIKDSLSPQEAAIVKKILADPIVDVASVDSPVISNLPEEGIAVEMSPKPGVTDPEGEAARNVIQRALGREMGPVSTARQYIWVGELDANQFIGLTKQLGNPLINEFRQAPAKGWQGRGIRFHFPDVNLPRAQAFQYLDLEVSDEAMTKLSDERLLAMNLEEMKTTRDLFRNQKFVEERKRAGLEAKPTDAELEAIAQSWSEHCIHKKLNAIWEYTTDDPHDKSGLPTITDSLFKSIIQEATFRIIKERGIDWLVSVFEDNAGVVRLNNNYNAAHKVESHNHPSALDGHGGANTGTGGVIRDPRSTGKGMSLVSSQWTFGVAHPNSYRDLPSDIQSPARTLQTVVTGVEDYGNKMGIPTMCGGVTIDDGLLKPRIGVGCVAVAPAKINGRDTHTKDIRPGYIIISVGGKVGKDGIHGATGSSTDLSATAEQSSQVNQSVQIGNPIVEKNVFETMDILEELDLLEATQDCGAGGWNSAVGELAGLLNDLEATRYEVHTRFEERGVTVGTPARQRLEAVMNMPDLRKVASPFADQIIFEITTGEIFRRKGNGRGGVVMDLTHAPEKYAGLAGWEKLVSEAQEREVLVVKPENLERVLKICEHNNVEATQIGVFNDSGAYRVLDQDKTMVFLPVEFLHRGLPQMRIKAHWSPSKNKEPEIRLKEDLTGDVNAIMRAPNVQLYDWIITRYDHEVQGGSRLKPIVGKGRGRSDAIAYRPILTEKEVIIETWASNIWQGQIDAYEMGVNNVVDAVGRVIAAGGNLEKIAFNGNTFCPKPEKDVHIAAQVARMLKGSADAEVGLSTPRISGKDSTGMERSYTSTETGQEVKVKSKSELLMSAMAIIPDESTVTSPDFKNPGDLVYVVGETRDELGASEFYAMHNEVGRNVPVTNLPEIKARYQNLSVAIKIGVVHSCQYVGRGGLAAAIANCAIAGDLGAKITLDPINKLGRADKILFSETTGRFVVTVPKSKRDCFESAMGDYAVEVGEVRLDSEVCIRYQEKNVVSTTTDELRESYKGEIRF